jgi:hypothetical protein
MIAPPLPPRSRTSLILPALCLALPLALAQGCLISLFFGLCLIPPLHPWFVGMLPWLFGMPIGFAFTGGLCALRTTSHISDETISEKRGRLSGFLMGLLSSLLGLGTLLLLFVWYTNWWIPTLSANPPLGCVGHVTPLSCMSPQFGARWSLAAVVSPVFLAFLLGNIFFVSFAAQSGAFIARLRARQALERRFKEEQGMLVVEADNRHRESGKNQPFPTKSSECGDFPVRSLPKD